MNSRRSCLDGLLTWLIYGRWLLDGMREQRDRWQAQADRLSSVLTDPKEGTPMVAMAALDAGCRPPSNYAVRDNSTDLKSD
jgi:hypothetical protein